MWTDDHKKLFERRWISSHMKEEVTSDQVKLLWHDLITLLSWRKKCSGLFKGPDSQAWTLDCCFSGHMLVEQQPTICDIFFAFKGSFSWSQFSFKHGRWLFSDMCTVKQFAAAKVRRLNLIGCDLFDHSLLFYRCLIIYKPQQFHYHLSHLKSCLQFEWLLHLDI